MQAQEERRAGSPVTSRRHRKIQRDHLQRQAVVYVRQSTLRQVHHHQESGTVAICAEGPGGGVRLGARAGGRHR